MTWRCPKCGAYLVLAVDPDAVELREEDSAARRNAWQAAEDQAQLREARGDQP